ncbi:SRPBCC domain-containing protein [Mycolicibacterium flavescens]|uniref:ATPase n=1 Tax=Mycolicibacterium flavescens TaxID=1776 RepID=A0A1E3RQ72_MYCFV|nr:SRPBCC domain-containing protein [Mycolicibacterium flavescens]MCV7278068.1 SRPBCC domain-containing protein [Mycolicibacterium flavescens]ODQ91557.1 ATPase [Mycolicibacterium flavescens]
MPLNKDESGRRWVATEVLVPGTPEQVWQAIATGAGMSSWFTTTSVEEHVGGAVQFNFGDVNCGEAIQTGRVTGWDPPNRFAYEEYGWSGDAPPVATEVTVTSRSGDRCVVRMVHSLFTDRDDWDDELESFEGGWPGFYEVLKVYLADFPGARSALVHSAGQGPVSELQAWRRLTEALGLAGADVGERRETPADAPRLAGVVRRVHQDGHNRDLMMRLEQPAPGVAIIGACTVGEEALAMVTIYFYGDDAQQIADAEQPGWSTWLRGLLQPEPAGT